MHGWKELFGNVQHSMSSQKTSQFNFIIDQINRLKGI